MKNFNLQLFADGEGAADTGGFESATAENTGASSENTKETKTEKAGALPEKTEETKAEKTEKTEKTAGADEKSADDIKEGSLEDGKAGAGEETPLPPKEDYRLLQSLQTALNETLKNREIKKIIDDWEKSGEELKEIYPDFDLKTELKNNGDFRQLLKAGVSVRRAFETANLEKILGSALRYAVLTAGKKTADSVRSFGGRVQENPVQGRASSLSRKDVNSLTKNDILKILDEVSRGATIKF